MGKYDFIKLGNLLYWHDPDSGLSNGVYQVASIPENIEEDSVILIYYFPLLEALSASCRGLIFMQD